MSRFWLIIAWLSVRIFVHADDFQGSTHVTAYDEEPISYSKTAASNAVTRLQGALESGAVKLAKDPKLGLLPALLKEFGIPAESQGLVFSKSSFQRDRIHPGNPRAVYFNDDVYIGFIPGSGMLEISVADPQLGGIFYTLDQDEERPKFTRNDQCLECHVSGKTMGVPGHLLRSFEVDRSGAMDLSTGVSLVTHRTPFAERWGGWFVTGEHGEQTHRGNLIGKTEFERQTKEPNFRGNQTSPPANVDVSRYPAGSSDIVALMVLQHQVHMHNFITRLHHASDLALAQYGHVKYLNSIVDGFVRYLLFVEETPLVNEVRGNTTFAERFATLGPRDSKGRSLREFDLKTRLFKWPCSYLIYSEAFDSLPAAIKERVYERLWDVLSGKETSSPYAMLTADTRQGIREILSETKNDLPEWWKNGAR